MKLLVVRHGRAGTAAAFARSGHASDDLRPLTVDGRKRMRRAAAGLKVACPHVDVLGTSPLVRAIETAQIVVKAYGHGLSAVEVPSLAPGGPRDDLVRWLQRHAKAGGTTTTTVVVVGHEPGLGRFVGWLLAGDTGAAVELKKGAACLLDVPEVRAGRARLLWLLPPRLLRRLAP